MVKKIKRWYIHSCVAPWKYRKLFPQETLNAIESAIHQSESQHSGELRFVIEHTLPSRLIWQGVSSWQRALKLFSNLRVWDTEENSGVLIYLLLAERTVHIVADRGINKKVSQTQWDEIALTMQQMFQQGHFQEGSLMGINQITCLLIRHFPASADNPNELPDTPIVLH